MAKERTFAEFTRMAKAGLTEQQIFTSGAMAAMFTNIATFVTGRYERRCTVKVKYSSAGDDTAATDGDEITIDTNTSLLKGLGLLEKVKGLIGLIYHECGHILFTDFKLAHRCMDTMMAGDKLLPEPVGLNKDVDAAYKTYQDLSGKLNKNLLIQLWHTVQNCVEDGAIENFLRTLFPGYAGCLNTLRNIMFEKDTPINEIPEKPGACISFILQTATCHKIKGTLVTETYDLTGFSEKATPLIEKAIRERDSKKRNKLINGVYVLLVDELFRDVDLKDKEKESGGKGGDPSDSKGDSSKKSKGDGDSSSEKSGSSKSSGSCSGEAGDGGSSGSGSSMSDLIKSLEEAMGKAADHKSAGSTKEASGRDSSSVDIKHAEEFDDADEKGADSKASDERADDELESELESIKADAIKKEAGKLAESELKRDFAKESGYSDGIPFKVIRPEIPIDAEERYQNLRHALGPTIKTASRMLAREIEDRKLGEIQHGKIYGRAIDQTCLSRLVGGKMMSKRLPEDKPNMAVMCLVDESGSMSCQGRIPAAINAAFVVNGFCEELSLPLSIYGHSEKFTGNHTVEMRSYREFGFDGDRNAAKRLLGIDVRENNRDGFAIRFCTERLKKRDENVKLLLIVSDGAPAAYRYMDGHAINDVRAAVAEARKAGIIVVTAGIGSDSESIRDVYLHSSIKPKDRAVFLDVSNPQDLTRELVKILKRTARMAI